MPVSLVYASDLTDPATPAASAEEEAYRFLLDAICTGKYRAGQRLKSEEISIAIGMSRMPVREAFRRLSAEGLLTVRPNRGVVVTGLDLDAMREIFEMRAVLEGLAARVAVSRLTDQNLTTLKHLLTLLDQCGEDPAEWVIRHRDFHAYLSALSARPRLTKQITSLHALIEPYMRLWFAHARKPRNSHDAHEAVFAALSSKDPDLAERTIRQHVEMTVPPLLEFMAGLHDEPDQ